MKDFLNREMAEGDTVLLSAGYPYTNQLRTGVITHVYEQPDKHSYFKPLAITSTSARGIKGVCFRHTYEVVKIDA